MNNPLLTMNNLDFEDVQAHARIYNWNEVDGTNSVLRRSVNSSFRPVSCGKCYYVLVVMFNHGCEWYFPLEFSIFWVMFDWNFQTVFSGLCKIILW